MKLLVVDDSLVMRRIIVSAASVVGAECVEARDGRPRVPAHHPLRRALKTLPVLMITTEISRDSILAALKDGATGYLTEPFNRQDLQSKLMECLGLGS
jgi:CheY-like chemotaxis protein